MTIFTKSDTIDEKKDIETGKEIPKVIVSQTSNQPTADAGEDGKKHEEGKISNFGWIPMEGGNFDRPKEKRSSSFGPLSIIRLSPSPLARTPSPSPEYDNAENERRFRRFTKFTLIFCLIMGVGIAISFFFYQRGLIESAYRRGLYHGLNAVAFNNKGVAERLEQQVEVDPNEAYEKIDVPRFGSNRPAIFLHDFKQNFTAIVDVMGKRCFVKQLDRNAVAPPRNFIDMLKGFNRNGPLAVAPRVVRETFRVGQPLSQEEVDGLQSFMISRHCSYRPTYMLKKTSQAAEEMRRNKREILDDTMETLEFAANGGDGVEIDVVTF
ncbi:hypothetical protein WR25_10304 [Diploscapter pachys]|uniref:Integral membrane protein 2 n=1 Tax=Diploscapter pachys TaxID=2018661 RepID=A0A2A2KXV3_9BILA|nr:hypothetical protein WR25_08296 [Diploscapter pachys]PAV78969.1 hypothetical protein WR25_10304 [Diploscapter pachys]